MNKSLIADIYIFRTTIVGNELIVHQSNQNNETSTINDISSASSSSQCHQYSSALSISPQTVTTKASIDSFSAIENSCTLNRKSPTRTTTAAAVFTPTDCSTNFQRDSANNTTINHSVDRMSGGDDNHVTILSIKSEEIEEADNGGCENRNDSRINDESNINNNFCINEFSNCTTNELSNNNCSNNLTDPTPDVSDPMSTDHKTDNCNTKNLVNTHQNFENINKKMLDSRLRFYYGVSRASRSREPATFMGQMSNRTARLNIKCESGIS